MPAHITVLFPFLALDCIKVSERDELRRLFANHAALPVAFNGFGSFPQMVYLRPEPAAPLVELTSRVARRWPEAPPYAGAFDDVVPHLTIAAGVDDVVAGDIRADVACALPLRTVLREAWLMAFADGKLTETFALSALSG
jgi:2'-5' RNA ligase